MLLLTREIGEAILIEDVAVTLICSNPNVAEVSLQKLSGGKKVTATLLRGKAVDACYETQLIYIGAKGTAARIGVNFPKWIRVVRTAENDE